jgi:hypothetical protein
MAEKTCAGGETFKDADRREGASGGAVQRFSPQGSVLRRIGPRGSAMCGFSGAGS